MAHSQRLLWTFTGLLISSSWVAGIEVQSLDDEINDILKAYQIPGAAVSLFTADSVIYARGLGFADIEARRPMTTGTVFRLASMTKTFTAMGILTLEAAGRVDLADPVVALAPEVWIRNRWAETSPVRVVHLLEHTAGFNELHFNDYNLTEDPDVPLTRALEVGRNSRVVRWPPGSMYSYTSSGYAVAGYLLERLTGNRFEDFLARSILRPLGMDDSSFQITPKTRIATGYERDNGVDPPLRPSPIVHSYSRSAASLNSNLDDLTRFVQFLLAAAPDDRTSDSSGEVALLESVVPRMERVESLGDPATRPAVGGGCGLGSFGSENVIWHGHKGADVGFAGAFAYSRELGAGYVVLTNYYDTDFAAGVLRLERLLQRTLAAGHPPAMSANSAVDTPTTWPTATASTPWDVASSADTEGTEVIRPGLYVWANPPQKLVGWLDSLLSTYRVGNDGGSPTIKEGGSDSIRTLVPTGPGVYRFSDAPYASVAYSSQNAPTLIVGTEYYRRTPVIAHYVLVVLLFASMVLVTAAIPWAAVHVIRLVVLRLRRCGNPSVSVPLVLLGGGAVALLGPLILVATQPMILWGQRTAANLAFFVGSILFAGSTVAALVFLIAGWRRERRIPTAVLSLGQTVLLAVFSIHGIIGLRLWLW